VALALLLAFSGMLYATFRYVRTVRTAGETRQGQQAGATAATKTGIAGSEFVTTTDVNLRKGPDPSYAKVGTAEVGSTVRVMQVSGKWYQVEVVEHGRPKSDPDSADEGWVNSTLLKAKS
jgi:SH3-like domain-containing protein